MDDPELIIKGGVYKEPTLLKGLLAKRMNIAYGRNGSGKSTIARAFREQQPDRRANSPAGLFELSFDGSGSLPQEFCEHLFVFNEDFIDDNVKVSDGLKTIIRIGSSAKLDAPIKAANDKIKEYKGIMGPIKDKLDILDGSPSTAGSIKEAEKEFKAGLKKSGGYVERLAKIEGKQSQSLVASIVTPVLHYDRNDKLPDSISVIAMRLQEKINRFLSYKSGSIINWQIPRIYPLPNLDAINGILAQTVSPAQLTDEERHILDELNQMNAAETFIQNTENLIIKSSLDFCPLCHQSVSGDHRHTLEQRIVNFRDKKVQEFKAKVSGMADAVQSIDIALPSFPTPEYDADLNHAASKLQALNSFISGIKDALAKKVDNSYSAQTGFDPGTLSALVKDCEAALAKIDADVTAYNRILQDKDRLKSDIVQTNIRLAYHENKTEIDAYIDRTAEREELAGELERLNGIIRNEQKVIGSLTAQIDQVDDARTQINHYLDIIFGFKKLRLVPAGKDKYKLQIKQCDDYTDIPPRAISSGERNALALAYFFACVLEKKNKDYDYSDPTYLVIDDPISSFDSENKAGVLSLLSFQIKKILKGNPGSKVLVFTHDITTLRELCDQRAHLFQNDNAQTEKYLRFLPKHTLKEYYCTTILENMEYYSDFQNIFKFAKCQDPDEYDNVDSIGNEIRKFAESYATRMFRCKWNSLFSDEKRLKCLPEDIQEDIHAFAIRPILNSESHSVERSFEPTELQRAARVLLIYIYYASRDHLTAYLVGHESNNAWKISKIEEWVDEFGRG